MGKISTPEKAKLICGILASKEHFLKDAKNDLCSHFGNIETQSNIMPFNFTYYYCDEMGENILRQYISFFLLIPQDLIAEIKISTTILEKKYSKYNKRKINLDPGYITFDKMVLATTKPATYRIYLGKGIYAQSTLFYRNGTYQPWEWTYPDYKLSETINYFNEVRKQYKKQLPHKDIPGKETKNG